MINLTDLCAELKNWFVTKVNIGDFEIAGGTLITSTLPVDSLAQDGQYIRIVGSVFNDGVYQYPVVDLIDESFHGGIWLMAVPSGVISLLDEINSWLGDDSIQKFANSPFQSESFGGYTYSKASGSSTNGSTGPITWQQQFASKLNRWRKIRA